MITAGERGDMKDLVKYLDLHPAHAQRLAAALSETLVRTDMTVPDLIAALEASAEGPPTRDDAINIIPQRPTPESIRHHWRRNTDVDAEFLQGQYDYQSSEWDRLYAVTTPDVSRSLTEKVVAAFAFDWRIDDAPEVFEDKFGDERDIFRSAIRPWPEEGWTGIEVGNVKFHDTPADFYRLLYLCKPVALDFDDMYGCGLFGITSPCARFAMQFYFHKYELAAFQSVVADLAERTRPEYALSITCGIPGADNGVATTDKDANQWFSMVASALKRKWGVYPGNDFEV